MANEPERISLRLASVLGGAMLWIAVRADRGHPVTRDEFIEEFSGPAWDADYGADLLDELSRRGLIEMRDDGALSITRRAAEWIDEADFWKRVASELRNEPNG